MQRIGSYRVQVTLLIENKLYQSVSIPKLTYGVEAMDIGSEVMQEMEAFHCYSAKLINTGSAKASSNSRRVGINWMRVPYNLWVI